MRKLPFLMAFLVAATSLFANTYEGSTVQHSFVRRGKQISGEFREAVQLTSQISRVETEVRYVNEWVYDCEDDESVDNARGKWYGFFQASNASKPYRLTQAIRGISLRTARDLVREGTFDTKPRSWSDFARRIEEADDKFGTGFSYSVLVTNKRENMINLGYLVEGRCGLRMTQVRRRVPVRKPVKDVTRQFIITVNGGALLQGEDDTFTLTFDGFETFLNYSESKFNKYTLVRTVENSSSTEFVLSGERRQVRPNNSLTVGTMIVNDQVRLNVYDTAFDRTMPGARFIVGTVEVVRGGWRGNAFLANFEAPLSGFSPGTDLFDLGIQVPAGQKIEIRYELKVLGSAYYSPEPSITRSSRSR